ncbi:hypothetical protein [uncultured Propionibacterium sp.]|uniref:hypothetical protein n=1 Tax=uncultured Propionibacterium sp. TaxID=218066 RepID=UPI002930C893|nr:hypothetical protein [uncultured Propionibacterium sp.]
MVSRRMILAVPVLGSFAACAPSPVVRAGSAAATDALGPDDPRYVGAVVETDLAALVEACRTAVSGRQGGEDLGAWCEGAATAHASHIQVLLQADPLGGTSSDHSPTADSPAPSTTAAPTGPAAAQDSLAQAYQDAVASHSAAAAAEQDASMRMLWSSLAVFAGRSAAVMNGSTLSPAPIAGQAVPVRVGAGSALDAAAALVSRVDALRYGLETMIGRSGGTRPDMSSRRNQVDALRVDLAERIAADGGQAAGPDLEYGLSGDPDDADARDGIWAGLEDDVLAGWLRLAAATPGASGSSSSSPGESSIQQAPGLYGLDEIVGKAVEQAGQAPLHGLGTSWWPGWV